ncbi:serine/threonine-protein kinase [Micromonospora sp. WMMA1363]|uniref:serine/threonine-protein kinase n=1 Tax=Micromonospora sp. WMMA1363 TaxID=3053985 RepID=UPI00259D0A0C|nr:serine/threonine-protein kinase [Micromonospora sp. WMMA1363]MDM4721310.1 serine/threonine-protein kinase [Micromonospora sp. WMMA1363]
MPIVPGLTDLRVFARGGYATVYKATQISVGREVALKVENRTLDSERDQARFLREARAAGRMSSHPHVVDLFDVGVTVDQHPYLIMELCDGSYAERMRTSPLGPLETRDLGMKIADAIAHSHAAGVLHRDVKPANILHSHFNPAVLADFGLAVVAEMRDASVALEVLTPAYAPPEMFNHSPPSPAVDVYALCATLYAVMHGRPPRWRSERNPSLVTVLEMFHQPIQGLPGVPEEMIDILRAGMSNDPGARPSAAELRNLLAGLPLGGVVPGHGGLPDDAGGGAPSGPYVVGRSARPAPRPPAEDQHPTVPAAGRRRRRWFLGGAGAVALAAAAGAGAWLAGGMFAPVASPTADLAADSGPRPACAQAAELPDGAHCGDELECFGPLEVRGARARAARVPCAGEHTWESYAEGELPDALLGAGYDEVSADPTVRRVCNLTTFRLTSGVTSVDGWNLEVLPPEVADRTYRCLAGRGLDALASPTFTVG